MKNGLLSNSATSLLSFFSKAIITFFLTPVYLNALGREDYGIWELVSLFIGYAALLDLGIRHALVRQTAFTFKHSKPHYLSSLYSSALIYMGCLGSILALGLLTITYCAPELIVPDNATHSYTQFYTIVAGLIFLGFFQKAAEGVLEGRQLYAIKNILDILIRSAVAIAIYFYLTKENGLEFMVLVYFCSTILALVAYNILLIKIKPSIYALTRPSMEQFRELVKFGIKNLISGSAFTLQNTSGTLVIGMVLGPAFVVLYSIPKTLFGYVGSLLGTLTQPLLPFLTENSDNSEDFKRYFLAASNLVVWFVWTSLVFIFFYGADFMIIWLGNEQADVVNASLIGLLCVVVFLEKLSPMGLTLAQAMNKHGFFAKWRPVSAVLTFTVTYIAVSIWGVIGAPFGLLITNVIFVPVFLIFSNRLANVTMTTFIKHVLLENTIVTMVLVATVLLFKTVVMLPAKGYLDIGWAAFFVAVVATVLKFISISMTQPMTRKAIIDMSRS